MAYENLESQTESSLGEPPKRPIALHNSILLILSWTVNCLIIYATKITKKKLQQKWLTFLEKFDRFQLTQIHVIPGSTNQKFPTPSLFWLSDKVICWRPLSRSGGSAPAYGEFWNSGSAVCFNSYTEVRNAFNCPLNFRSAGFIRNRETAQTGPIQSEWRTKTGDSRQAQPVPVWGASL